MSAMGGSNGRLGGKSSAQTTYKRKFSSLAAVSILGKAPRLDGGRRVSSSSSTLPGPFGGEPRVINEETIEQVFRCFRPIPAICPHRAHTAPTSPLPC